MARGASFKELDEADGIRVASQDLPAKLRNHLRDGEEFVLQFNAGDFFFALQDLLNAYKKS